MRNALGSLFGIIMQHRSAKTGRRKIILSGADGKAGRSNGTVKGTGADVMDSENEWRSGES